MAVKPFAWGWEPHRTQHLETGRWSYLLFIASCPCGPSHLEINWKIMCFCVTEVGSTVGSGEIPNSQHDALSSGLMVFKWSSALGQHFYFHLSTDLFFFPHERICWCYETRLCFSPEVVFEQCLFFCRKKCVVGNWQRSRLKTKWPSNNNVDGQHWCGATLWVSIQG